MKKFAYAMAATQNEHPDYPSLAAQKLGISQNVALAMENHVERYADRQILNELQRSGIGPGGRVVNVTPDAQQSQFADRGPSVAALNGSTPTKIMDWLLNYVFRRDVEPHKGASFLEVFRMDEAASRQANSLRIPELTPT
jgi:hypothetical protein